MNDGYYHDVGYHHDKNTVFELEVFWNKDRLQANLDRFNRCKKHNQFEEICSKADSTISKEITLQQ